MAGEKHRIEFDVGLKLTEADVQQLLNVVKQTFEQATTVAFQGLQTKLTSLGTGGTGSGAYSGASVVNPQTGQAALFTGADPNSPMGKFSVAMTGVSESLKKVSVEFDNMKQKFSDLMDNLLEASKAQKDGAEAMTKELKQIPSARRADQPSIVPSGAETAPPVPPGRGRGDMISMLGGAVRAGTIAQLLSGALNIPLTQLGAAAAWGRTEQRDITSMFSMGFEDVIRMRPENRQMAGALGILGGAGSVLGYAGIGAGIGSLIAPGIGTAIGGVAGGAYALLSGRAATTGMETFNTALRMLAEAQGTGRYTYETARDVNLKLYYPLQRALNIGGGSETNLANMLSQRADLGFTPDERMRTGVGMIGFGGSQFFNAGNIGRTMEMGRATGLGPESFMRYLNASGGIAGFRGTAQADEKKLEEIIAKGMVAGINNAELLKRYLDTTTTIMQAAGGGYGASASGYASTLYTSAFEAFGARGDLAAQATRTTNEILSNISGSRTGLQGVANWLAAGSMGMGGMEEIFAGMSASDMGAFLESGAMEELTGLTGSAAKRKGAGLLRRQLATGLSLSPFGARGLTSKLGGKGRIQLTTEEMLAWMKHLMWVEKRTAPEAYGFVKSIPEFINKAEQSVELEGRNEAFREMGLQGSLLPDMLDFSKMATEKASTAGTREERIGITGTLTGAIAGQADYEKALTERLAQLSGTESLIKQLSDVDANSTNAAASLEKVVTQLKNIIELTGGKMDITAEEAQRKMEAIKERIEWNQTMLEISK